MNTEEIKEGTPGIFIKHNLPSDFTISLRLLFISLPGGHNLSIAIIS